MEPQHMLRTIWRRLWIVALCTVLVSLTVFGISTSMQPVYRAGATLIVRQPVGGAFVNYSSLMTGETLARTYGELLKARPLLEMVIGSLGLSMSPEELSRDMLRTRLVVDTQLLELTIDDTDPRRASELANELAYTFVALHNTEHQVGQMAVLERDIEDQLQNIQALIARNQLLLSDSAASPGLLSAQDPAQIEMTLASQQAAYTGLLSAYVNMQLTQSQLLDVAVVEPAVPPTSPVRPVVPLYTLLGGAIGLVLGIGLVFVVEYLDRSIGGEEDIARVLSLPTLAVVPQLQGRERAESLLAHAMPRSPAAEAFRTLRTNMRFASVDKPLRTLLVTSAEPQAGKSTVAANLGIVCAQAGLRVLLIDADLRRPTLHRLFASSIKPGLTELLADSSLEADDCIVPTPVAGLSFLASGTTPPNPSELLGSKKAEAVVASASQQVDLVILDTPPVLAVTDPSVLAARVDGAVLVIEAGRTTNEVARRAYQALRSVNANVVGAVLVKARVKHRYTAYYNGAQRSPSRGLRNKWARWLAQRGAK